MIAERISHYRMVSELCEDGMGEGYQAQDTNSIATLRVRFCWPGSLRRDLVSLGLLNGRRVGFRTHGTPTVSAPSGDHPCIA